ncbi:hypothetical protein DUI87_01048 [Hirundo rustica rustica]|uniref:Retroviral nucleocapsid Gag protein p24 C-terminal domain-containing protein n=1 Tax=Hirundo rustica rustica TaxID=333673 RepID=A0A3M0L3N8_HIRRU|nr:hypothetical protein DUI87_01048 [Hirundo rustica rustica]
MPQRGRGGETGNPEAGSDPDFSATPVTYRQSKTGGVVYGYWDTFPQQAIQDLYKAQINFGYESEYCCNLLKANLAGNPTVPFDLQRDLLPELWQNPETAVDNNNFPIQLEHLCGDSEWVSALKQAQEIPLLPSEPFVAFVERLTSAIELQVKEEGAQEQVLEEMALTNANEQCKAAILSLPMELAPTLDDMLQGRGYAYVSTPPCLKWVPDEWVKPFIPKNANPPAEAPQVASAAWRRRKR